MVCQKKQLLQRRICIHGARIHACGHGCPCTSMVTRVPWAGVALCWEGVFVFCVLHLNGVCVQCASRLGNTDVGQVVCRAQVWLWPVCILHCKMRCVLRSPCQSSIQCSLMIVWGEAYYRSSYGALQVKLLADNMLVMDSSACTCLSPRHH